MNDKQKLALKELADVMEKHGLTVDSNDTVWIDTWGEELVHSADTSIDGEGLRDLLKE